MKNIEREGRSFQKGRGENRGDTARRVGQGGKRRQRGYGIRLKKAEPLICPRSCQESFGDVLKPFTT